MFRDNLFVLGAKGAAASYALTFARHFEAEVTAVWPVPYSAFETIVDPQTRYDLVAAAEEQSEKESATRTLEFVEQAHDFRVKAHAIDAKDCGGAQFASFLRSFDLVVIGQPMPEQSTIRVV